MIQSGRWCPVAQGRVLVEDFIQLIQLHQTNVINCEFFNNWLRGINSARGHISPIFIVDLGCHHWYYSAAL